ncbi:MAG: hypothetical protein JWM88_718 [Verrucomicrobia bacterium]|nr:hypothetical protein [Verrucomicrobiota bacterium]
MKSWWHHCRRGASFCGHGALRLLRWTLWLVLSLALAFQIWIAASRELALPAFVLRMLEDRLAASQVQVKFGHARFDQAGRILVENVTLSLPAYREPIAVAQAAYLELDPWELLAGKFTPQRLHLTGARFAVPAMLSRSGQAEDIVRDLDATVDLNGNELVIEHLTARVAGIAAVARGGVHLRPRTDTRAAALPIADSLARNYPAVCRQLIRAAERLTALDQPELRVDLTPSETRAAIATVSVSARGLKLSEPYAVEAQGLRLTTRFPLQGDTPVMAPLTLEVDALEVGHEVSVRALRARLRGALHPSQYTYDPRDMQLGAAGISARGFAVGELSARLTAGPLPRIEGELVAECLGQLLAFRGEVDLSRRTASMRFNGALAPELLEPIERAIGRDVRPYLNFGAPVRIDARAVFEPGWKFRRLTGHFHARQVDAFRVPIDEGGGEIDFDGIRFVARHAFARLGDNFARGSFEQDFSDLRFRFLLEGRLRPLAISGWFGKWWPAFFEDFDFPVAPPEASVDVTGEWKQGRRTTVFVFADSAGPVVHGVKFDHMRTLMFIRPNFFDGLELFATIGSGAARGTFARQIDPATYHLVGMDLDFESSLPIGVAGEIFGASIAAQVDPVHFAVSPAIKLKARFDGPASPDGVHQAMKLSAQSTGEFSYYGFPLSELAVKVSLHDDEVALDDVSVNFAGGTVNGKARVWGKDAERRLGFDLALRGGSLGRAVRVMEEFSAARKGVPLPAPGKFVQDKAQVALDLAASAEGLFADPFSYKGEGHATLEGAALGEVHMLGLLSELLSFTSLRFTAARANFKVDGPRLVFSDIAATGANSAIDAHGSYDLRERQLDFKARLKPFQESKFLPSLLIGAVLTPFTSVLEVKLTGTIDKPSWAFVNGPTNFFRNLAKPSEAAPPKPDYLRR